MISQNDFAKIASACAFDRGSYPPAVQSVLQEPGMKSLGPGKLPASMSERLQNLDIPDVFDTEPVDAHTAAACLAGLLIYQNAWDRAHRVAQNIPTAEGSYWHAIIHRREPDAWNSKYWFRRVGQHPVYADLIQVVHLLAQDFADTSLAKRLRQQDRWDAFAFVDTCERVRDGGSREETFCLHIQLAEWMLLFKYCYDRAIS